MCSLLLLHSKSHCVLYWLGFIFKLPYGTHFQCNIFIPASTGVVLHLVTHKKKHRFWWKLLKISFYNCILQPKARGRVPCLELWWTVRVFCDLTYWLHSRSAACQCTCKEQLLQKEKTWSILVIEFRFVNLIWATSAAVDFVCPKQYRESFHEIISSQWGFFSKPV